MEQQANGSLHLVLTGIALAVSLSLGAPALGQQPGQGQNVGQEGTSRAGARSGGEEEGDAAAAAAASSIDAQTGKILNEAIELLNMEKYAEAGQRIGTLTLEKLSPYERGKVEQILFNIAYSQEQYEKARGHLKSAIDSGGLNTVEIDSARYQSAQLHMQEEKWREGAAALEEWFQIGRA